MEGLRIEAVKSAADGPAFSVQDGVICWADPAAEALGFQKGRRLSELLPQSSLSAPGEPAVETLLLLEGQAWSLITRTEGETLLCFLRPQSPELPGPNESTLLHAAGSIRIALQELHVALDGLSERISADEAAARQASLALRSVYRLRRTAAELERFSRLRLKQYQPTGESCRVVSRAAAFCGETQELLRCGGFDLSWSLPKQEFSLCLDWTLTETLLRELLANAAARSDDGRLRLELRRVGQNRLRFAVVNRQAKPLPETLFHRHAAAETLTAGGLGLGLSTVSAGAAAHGGGVLLSRAEDGTVTALLTLCALKAPSGSIGSPIQRPVVQDAALEAFSTILPPEAYRAEELL